MTNASREPRDHDHDLLDEVDVIVACNLCSETYGVPASIIRDSQRVIADGCSGGSLHECTASYFATLVEPEVLDELTRAWGSFERSATSHGGVAVAMRAPHATDEPPHELDSEALRRWENEGGHTELAAQPSTL